MEKFKHLINIDCDKLEALYGLPTKIEFCKKCVIANQRSSFCKEYKNSQNH